MRYSFIAASGFFALFGCAAPPLPRNLQPIGKATPTRKNGASSAVKAGDRQNYWNERDAQLNGAVVVFHGECPAEPNSEGFR